MALAECARWIEGGKGRGPTGGMRRVGRQVTEASKE